MNWFNLVVSSTITLGLIAIQDPDEYGPLAQVVSAAFSIMAAGGAIALSWRGRSNWEPWEEDISDGARKVAGLVAAVIILILWVTSGPADQPFLIQLTLGLLAATVLFLLVYGFIVGTQTYQKELVVDGSTNPPKLANKNVIGGFNLTPAAKKTIEERGLTVQEYYKGTAYDADRVWTRSSRTLAKQLFVVGYIGLVACGTIALAAAAILLTFRM